jgi:hypothetical protein
LQGASRKPTQELANEEVEEYMEAYMQEQMEMMHLQHSQQDNNHNHNNHNNNNKFMGLSGTVTVIVVRAQDLPTSRLDKTDGYIKVKLNNCLQQTNTINDTTSP